MFFKYINDPFHVGVESAPEYIQMKVMDLQCNNEIKPVFKTIMSQKKKMSNSRNQAQQSTSAFKSTYTYETFFSKI